VTRRPGSAMPQRRERDRSDAKARVLLEAAGPVFAEKGFAGATGKEICARAGVNAAAVNYYFGGIEGLHAAVLQEAHDRLLSYQAVSEAVAGQTDPEAKLRALLELIVRTLTGPASSSWMLRVLSREFLSPSPAMDALRRRELPRKAQIIRGIVSGLMGLPEDHPAVARGCVSVMAPCLMLLVADRRALKLAFPQLGLGAEDADAIAAHMVRYAVAGLTAVGREIRA
jgi:TetR/AcrR family transcriptional regulator, regulator of cefoperazone and chloramphenicol sensitivity